MSEKGTDNTAHLNADESGIFSYSASTSASECEALHSFDYHTPKTNYQNEENECKLRLELETLKGELKRASKSEQWYKQELHLEKSIRLKALRRNYDREQKFLFANQRLQRDYDKLVVKYNKLENELKLQKDKTMQQYKYSTLKHSGNDKNVSAERIFEIEQLHAIIHDQKKLINLLREQKQHLLQDINTLTRNADENVLKLQETLAVLEYENAVITGKCKQLLIEKNKLEATVKAEDAHAIDENVHKQQVPTAHEQLTDTLKILKAKLSSNAIDLTKGNEDKHADSADSRASAQELTPTERDAQIRVENCNANKLISSLESELITLNDSYANVCVLCEQTKLQIELLQIEQNKYKFIEKADKDDISALKEKLQSYMQQTETLSTRINELETEIERLMLERNSRKSRGATEAANMPLVDNQQRINCISQQLEQQNKKICLLNQQQADWEELLKACNTLQQLELNTKLKLHDKQAELEELNDIFFEQNAYLQELQQLYTFEQTARTEALQLVAQYESQITEMQVEYKNCQKKMQRLQQYVESVSTENKKLQRYLLICGSANNAIKKGNVDISNNKKHNAKTNYYSIDAVSLWSASDEENSNTADALNTTTQKHACSPEMDAVLSSHTVQCNLIDDNKELIQKSALKSGRLPNSAILELIEQSNKNVPSLKKLEDQLLRLRRDVQFANALMSNVHGVIIAPAIKSVKHEISLMEELRNAM